MENKELTKINVSQEELREIWVRGNQAVAVADPAKVLRELYDLKKKMRTVEIRLAKSTDLPGKMTPVWTKGGVMIVRLAVTGIFPDESRPTIVEGKLLKGQKGIGVQALQDRYLFGVADGKEIKRADQKNIPNNYTVRGPFADAILAFLKPDNMQKVLAGTEFEAFFGVEAPPAPVKEDVPDLEM